MILAGLWLGCSGSSAPVAGTGPDASSPGAAQTAAPGAVHGGGAEACAAAGGKCVAVSECAKGKGHLTDPLCGSPSIACCTPPDSCGGKDEFDCCVGSAVYRPVCKDGKLVCRMGSKCP